MVDQKCEMYEFKMDHKCGSEGYVQFDIILDNTTQPTMTEFFKNY